MEVIPGGTPFQRHNVEEWSRLDSLTGMLEHGRVETDHWSARTDNTSHKYGKVVDSRARNLADGSIQQRQRKQLEVFQAQVPGGSLQVIRTQSVTSRRTSSATTDFENLQLALNPLDLSSQKTKASVGRSGSIGGRRPPSRPRSSIISKIGSDISEESSLVQSSCLTEVSRLCRQVHEEAKNNVLTSTNVAGKEDKVEVVKNSQEHALLSRQKSCSTEDLQNDKNCTSEESDWRRNSKVRRSLHFPAKTSNLDFIPSNNVSKLRKELEEGKKLNMKNTISTFEALLKSDQKETTNNEQLEKKKLNPAYKRHSFVTVESLKEVRGRLRRLSSPLLDGMQYNSYKSDCQGAVESDDGIVTEECNKINVEPNLKSEEEVPTSRVKPYLFGMANSHPDTRKQLVGTGSLESRSGSSGGNRSEEWYNRRKSYGFEQVHNRENGTTSLNDKSRVESSTDSGICRSSETVIPSSWNHVYNKIKGNERATYSIHIKKQENEPENTFQKGRKTVVTLGSDTNVWSNGNEASCHVSEPVTVTIPISCNTDEYNNSSFKQAATGVQNGWSQFGITITNEKNSGLRNLSDESKSLAARRELLLKHSASRWSGADWSSVVERHDKAVKRHSIAVDETKYVRAGVQSYPFTEKRNSENAFRVNFTKPPDLKPESLTNHSISSDKADDYKTTALEDEEGENHLAGKKQKKVEFCKTEVHFAAEPGRFNIVETDEKPPPNNMFRRRRRNSSGTLQSSEFNRNSLPEIRFGDSIYEKKLLGGTEPLNTSSTGTLHGSLDEHLIVSQFQDDADKDDNIYTQANATIFPHESKEVVTHDINVVVDNSDDEKFSDNLVVEQNLLNDSRPRSILKNNRKPRPFLLGGVENESESRWGVRLKPVQHREPPSVWSSTVTLRSKTFEDGPKSLSEETETQKLLKSLQPAVQAKCPAEPEMKFASVAERVRQVEDMKHFYSTRVNFGAGEATVVENGLSDNEKSPLFQQNNRPKPIWLRREERKQAAKLENKSHTATQKSVTTAHLQSYNDSTRLRSVETLVNVRSGQPKITSISLRYEGDQDSEPASVGKPLGYNFATYNINPTDQNYENLNSRISVKKNNDYTDRTNFISSPVRSQAKMLEIHKTDSTSTKSMPEVKSFKTDTENERSQVGMSKFSSPHLGTRVGDKTAENNKLEFTSGRTSLVQDKISTYQNVNLQAMPSMETARKIEENVSRLNKMDIHNKSTRKKSDILENSHQSIEIPSRVVQRRRSDIEDKHNKTVEMSPRRKSDSEDKILTFTRDSPKRSDNEGNLNKKTETLPRRKLDIEDKLNFSRDSPRRRLDTDEKLQQKTEMPSRRKLDIEDKVNSSTRDSLLRRKSDIEEKVHQKIEISRDTSRRKTDIENKLTNSHRESARRKFDIDPTTSIHNKLNSYTFSKSDIAKKKPEADDKKSPKQKFDLGTSSSTASSESSKMLRAAEQQKSSPFLSLASLDSKNNKTNMISKTRHSHIVENNNRKNKSDSEDSKRLSVTRERSLSPVKTHSTSPMYENVKVSTNETAKIDSVETESAILEELTRAADQILQAVNGYTDEDSYKASSDDDYYRGENRRRGKKTGQSRRPSANLGTISETSPTKKLPETSNDKQNVKRSQRVTKPCLKATSSTSSVESLSREITHVSRNRTTSNVLSRSESRAARLLQRASSRELLLQSYASSSEDIEGSSSRKPVPPRRTRSHKTDTTINNSQRLRKKDAEVRIPGGTRKNRDAEGHQRTSKSSARRDHIETRSKSHGGGSLSSPRDRMERCSRLMSSTVVTKKKSSPVTK